MNPTHIQAPVVLCIGLWVDEVPEGELPSRAAPLMKVAQENGVQLRVVHHRALLRDEWLRTPPAAIMLSGSRLNLGEDCTLADFSTVTALLDRCPQTPVLGICFGHQLLAFHNGGTLERGPVQRSTTDWPVQHKKHALFNGLPEVCSFVENHVQCVVNTGPDFHVIAQSPDGIEAIAHASLPRFGVQFHPEYFSEQQIPNGRAFLANWFQFVWASARAVNAAQ